MSDSAADVPAAGRTKPRANAEAAADAAARDVEFELFYTGELRKLAAFLIVQGARPWQAADVAQEAMIEAYRQWDAIDTPRTWVRTVAQRAWWRQAETARREIPHDDLLEGGALLSLDESDEIDARHAFIQALQLLAPNQRIVMAWTYDGYQPTEIATVLGKPAATVRATLRDARAVLRQAYRPDGKPA